METDDTTRATASWWRAQPLTEARGVLTLELLREAQELLAANAATPHPLYYYVDWGELKPSPPIPECLKVSEGL